jgi:pimeloyl-ACP methyl ester carboxylesterase
VVLMMDMVRLGGQYSKSGMVSKINAMLRFRFLFLVFMSLGLAALAYGGAATRPAPEEILRARITAKGPLLLHLPGIGGPRWSDRRMLAGLRDGGVQANFVIYDWTEHDPGIDALQGYARNHREAKKIADLIAAHAAADPDSPIYLTAHSGGCALAVWALEKLPEPVKVQTVLLIAPALSPGYDLTAALRHVEGKTFVFCSTLDVVVLYSGTKLFGTMDGVRSPAAGFAGFVQPPSADPLTYQKLVQFQYRKEWARYFDFGDHIGAMSRPFAKAVLAPLIDPGPAPSTRPGAGLDSSRQ